MRPQDQPRDASGKWRPATTIEGQLDFTSFPGSKTQGSLLYPPSCDTAEELLTFYLKQDIPEHVVGMARSLYRGVRDNDPEVQAWVANRMNKWAEEHPRPDKTNPWRYRNGKHPEEIEQWVNAYDNQKWVENRECPLHPADLPRFGAPLMAKIAIATDYAIDMPDKREFEKFSDALLDWNGEIASVREKGLEYLLGDLGTALIRYYQWQGTETRPEIYEGNITTNHPVADVYTNPRQYESLRSREET